MLVLVSDSKVMPPPVRLLDLGIGGLARHAERLVEALAPRLLQRCVDPPVRLHQLGRASST